MPRYKVVIAKELEYTLEADNEDDAYQTVHNNPNDRLIVERVLNEETLSVEEEKEDDAEV